MADERIALLLDMGVSKENVRAVVEKLDGLDAAAKKAAAGAEKAAGKTADLGRTALESSRILQDFTQGGIGGILNNIEGFTRALGLGSGAAGLMTGVGVAAFIALPKVKSFFQALIDGANEVPRARGGVEGLADGLARTNKELDELKGKGVLTNAELARFNTLTAEAGRLQRELTDARKRDADFQRLREQKSDEQKETAELAGAFVGPNVDALRREAQGEVIRRGMQAQAPGSLRDLYERLRIAQRDRTEGAPQRTERARKALQDERDRLREEADKLVQGALSGRAGGLDMLLDYLPANSKFRPGLAELTPGARRRTEAEERAWNDQMQARADAVKSARERRTADSKRRAAEAEAFRSEGSGLGLIPGLGGMPAAGPLGQAAADARQKKIRGNLSAEKLARMDQDLREGVQASRMIQQQTGMRIAPLEALRIVKHQQQELLRAQSEQGQAVLDAFSGVQAQVQMLRGQARAIRQRSQPSTNAGWN